MKRAVILGGTFDPPHNGHLRILHAAQCAVNAQKAFIIPTCTPPHKSNDGVTSAKDRLEMCHLAAENIGADVLDIEMKRGGKSYTVDTLCELAKLYPDYELYLVMGSDMLSTLQSWVRYEEIIKRAKIIAFAREGISFDELKSFAKRAENDGASVTLLDILPDGISSTSIRQHIKEGLSVNDMVPENVLKYLGG